MTVSNTIKRSTAVIVITVTVLLAAVLAVTVMPLLVTESTVTTVGHCYPLLSISEMTDLSDRVEHCRLVQVRPAAYTSYGERESIITTDYIFESLEEEGGYLVLRLIGGTVGDTSVQNSDNTHELMTVGTEYVLFLRRHAPLTEPLTYAVDDAVVTAEHYYALTIGSASVFVSGLLNEDGTLSSASGQYALSPAELSALYAQK